MLIRRRSKQVPVVVGGGDDSFGDDIATINDVTSYKYSEQ
jgi:hypothetical protein